MAFLSYNLLFVAAWLFVLVAWESAAPARKAGSRWRRFGFHLSLTILNSALYEWFIGGKVAKTLGPSTSASAAHAAATLLALDFFLYWLHRANHWRWLWRFHQVHHSDTQLDVSTAFR